MRILFLTSGSSSPSTRYRVLAFLPHLRASGHVCVVAESYPQKYDWIPWLGFRPSQLLKRLVRGVHWLYARFARFDVIFVEREIFNDPTWSMEAKFRRIAPVFVLDLDDGVFLRFPEKFDRLCEMSDLLFAGNRFIAERLEDKVRRVVLLPTCVDTEAFHPRSWDAATTDAPVIGWIGTTGNLNYLRKIAPALRRLAQRRSFTLRLFAGGDEPLKEIDLAGVDVQFSVWDPEREIDDFRGFDVGIMPLADDEWDRYKCGLKLLQYMSVGVPGVATPAGVNAEIVRQGENGFLAETEEEWEAALEQLLSDAELRARLGRAARETVERKYSVAVHYPRLEAALRELVSGQRPRGA